MKGNWFASQGSFLQHVSKAPFSLRPAQLCSEVMLYSQSPEALAIHALRNKDGSSPVAFPGSSGQGALPVVSGQSFLSPLPLVPERVFTGVYHLTGINEGTPKAQSWR